MITRPTVFVLGAGSSQPYGLPTGAELVEEVIKIASALARGEERAIENGTGVPADIFEEMAKRLNDARPPLIDSWLIRNPPFQLAGRICITRAIAEREDPQKLKGDWMAQIWYKIYDRVMEPSGLADNKVSFITFNYDRCLEAFLHRSASGMWADQKDACIAALSQIPIVHIYGHVGRLSWQTGDDTIRPYDIRDLSLQILSRCSAGVRFMNPLHRESISTAWAKKLLYAATHIYFLGFGYHQDNMELLAVPGIQPRLVLGTCLRPTRRREDIINPTMNGWGVGIQIDDGRADFQNMEIFVREIARLE